MKKIMITQLLNNIKKLPLIYFLFTVWKKITWEKRKKKLKALDLAPSRTQLNIFSLGVAAQPDPGALVHDAGPIKLGSWHGLKTIGFWSQTQENWILTHDLLSLGPNTWPIRLGSWRRTLGSWRRTPDNRVLMPDPRKWVQH